MTNADKIILLFIITGLLNLSFSLFGQEEKKWYNGFGIEGGAGYHTMEQYYGYGDFSNASGVQPTQKIFYSITLHDFSENRKIKMPVFIGYYPFGGKGTYTGLYLFDPYHLRPTKTITFFRSVEAGINPCIEKNKFQFGLLLKGQYIFSAKVRMYMVDGLNPPFWKETDISKDYKTFAMNTGIKLKYKIIKGFSIAGEAWFGITNLYANSTYGSNGKLKIFENNYRLLLGYEF